jgi:hypothetical protein
LKKKEIKGHPDARKGLEAPSPENAITDVLLSHPPYFSPAKAHFCYQRQRYPSITDPISRCASLILAARLLVLIANPGPKLNLM